MNPVTADSTIGVVILTMGTRPAELDRAVSSVLMQRDVTVDVVVVGNGWDPTGLDERVRVVALPENVGIPDGRNAGVPHVQGPLLFFLDDDCFLDDDQFLRRIQDRFVRLPTLGMVQPHIVDPDGLPAPRRWVPRLRVGDPDRSSPVAAVVEMAIAVRRDAFDYSGGWAPGFFYAHEGIDFAWRVWDSGLSVWYAGDLRANHPVVDPKRHADAVKLDARNRVWTARRNLPVPLAATYVGVWSAITWQRRRDSEDRRAYWDGIVEGWQVRPAGVKRLKWSTMWRMAAAGRPPVI